MPLADFLVHWISWLKDIRKMSSHTVAAYEADIQQFFLFQKTHLGKDPSLHDLELLSLRDFRAWLSDRLAKEYEHRSTARALSVVRNFFRFLEKQGYSPNTAVSRVRSPRIKVGIPRPLSAEQAKDLLETIGTLTEKPWVGFRDRALFTLLYSAGLRLGEALALSRKQAPLESDTLLIRGKGKKERLVPVLPIVQETLKAYTESCPFILAPEGPLFVGEKGGGLQPGIAQKTMRHYRRMVGLPETATPHALRHSCATHLMNASGDLRGIQELLGHASLSSTQVYTNVDTSRLINVYSSAHPRAKVALKPRVKDAET